MSRRSGILRAVAVVAAAGFLVGVVHLIRLRFEAGDIYPLYSSLRADPLGTDVLHDSLARLPDVTVRRNFRPFSELPDGGGKTLMLLGVEPAIDPDEAYGDEQNLRKIEEFIFGGGRLVVAMHRARNRLWPSGKHIPTSMPAGPGRQAMFGFTLAADKLTPAELIDGVPALLADGLPALPGAAAPAAEETVYWHSPCYFSDLSAHWRVIYTRDDKPVVIYKSFGARQCRHRLGQLLPQQ